MSRRALLCALALALASPGGCVLFAAPCDTSADCDEGACVEGFCDPATAPREDAGPARTDAGPSDDDAGAGADAGPVADAGQEDAGAGAPDAGVRDAGPHPSYASVLDDDDSVLNPLWGSGMNYVLNTFNAPAFFPELTAIPPRVTLLLDAPNEQLELPVAVSGSRNADLRTGSLTVDYKPIYAHDDDQNHIIFSIEDPTGSPAPLLQARKAGSSNNNKLQLTASGGGVMYEVQVATTELSLTQSAWHTLHFTWDFRGTTDDVHIYVDGAEVGTPNDPAADVTMPQPDAAQWLVLGGRRPSLNRNALAQFDNLEVWREVRPPPAP